MSIEEQLVNEVLKWFQKVKIAKPDADWGEFASIKLTCQIHEYKDGGTPTYTIHSEENFPTSFSGESKEDKFKQLLK